MAHLAAAHLDRSESLAAPVVNQQIGGEILVVALDIRKLQRGLKQRVKYVKTRLVCSEPGTLDFHAAERPHRHRTVRFAVPGTAPVLQLEQLLGRLVDEIFDGILVAQPVTAADRIVKVLLETVVRFDHPRRPALRRAGMAAHRINLGDQCNANFGIRFGQCDGSAQTRAPRSDNGNIRLDRFHCVLLSYGQCAFETSVVLGPAARLQNRTDNFLT